MARGNQRKEATNDRRRLTSGAAQWQELPNDRTRPMTGATQWREPKATAVWTKQLCILKQLWDTEVRHVLYPIGLNKLSSKNETKINTLKKHGFIKALIYHHVCDWPFHAGMWHHEWACPPRCIMVASWSGPTRPWELSEAEGVTTSGLALH